MVPVPLNIALIALTFVLFADQQGDEFSQLNDLLIEPLHQLFVAGVYRTAQCIELVAQAEDSDA